MLTRMLPPPSDSAASRDQPPQLDKVLGLFSVVAIVVGEVIGSGIFFKPQEVAKYTEGFVGLILALWIACGLVNLCGADDGRAGGDVSAGWRHLHFPARDLRPAVVIFVGLGRILGHP